MQAVEETFEKAVQDGTIPGAVLLAETHDGSIKYAKAMGVKSLDTGAPMTLDTTMAIASCTKLLTTISILQLFQSGKLTPETDVLAHLPELAELQILEGFDDAGKPKLRARKVGITVRNLLTHTNGGTYLFLSPKIVQYWTTSGKPMPHSAPAIVERAGSPLVYEPGEGWEYSMGLDWAGLLLERLTGTDLDAYMRAHIWAPLGISTDAIGFWPAQHAGLQAAQAGLATRDDPADKVRFDPYDPMNTGSTDAFGGHGLFASMPAYMRVLRSLVDPRDATLLNAHWKEAMFTPQLTKVEEDRLNAILNHPVAAAQFVGEVPAARVRYSWGYGGLLSLDDDPGWRGKGTLLWSGYMNLLWYIDRQAGLCVLFGAQVAPPGDLRIQELMTTFEKGVYAQLQKGKERL